MAMYANAKSEIITVVCDAQLFSIILDTTQDITKKDQLSQVIRYVTLIKDSLGKSTVL